MHDVSLQAILEYLRFCLVEMAQIFLIKFKSLQIIVLERHTMETSYSEKNASFT